MTQQRFRVRNILSRFGTLIESLIIFILLFSGVGVIMAARFTNQIVSQFFAIGIGVEVVAVLIVGLYVYFRFLRQTELTPT